MSASSSRHFFQSPLYVFILWQYVTVNSICKSRRVPTLGKCLYYADPALPRLISGEQRIPPALYRCRQHLIVVLIYYYSHLEIFRVSIGRPSMKLSWILLRVRSHPTSYGLCAHSLNCRDYTTSFPRSHGRAHRNAIESSVSSLSKCRAKLSSDSVGFSCDSTKRRNMCDDFFCNSLQNNF